MVGKVDHKEDPSTRNVCFRFGNVGHKASDHRCPVKAEQSRKCNERRHFEAVCKAKRKQNSIRSRGLEECIEHAIEGVEEAILKGM